MISKKWMMIGAVAGVLITVYMLFFNKQGVTEPGTLATANKM